MMLRIPSQGWHVNKIFREFTDAAVRMVKHVVAQRNSWRTAAIDLSRELAFARGIITTLTGKLDGRAHFTAKLQRMLISKVVECNRATEARDHYQAAIRQMLSGQLISTDSAEHIYLMRNDYVYRNAYERTFGPSNLRRYFK
jgi:hypothetical protein